uniref:Uncharacterized protein n=1 Tax=Cacopsylla melanoneura TaxID=428564 RepID=A0A8D8XAE4_9HEMI
MYVLKIILVSLVSQLSHADSENPSQNYEVTSYSTSTPDTIEEIRSLVTQAAQDVVSIGFTRHKTERHKPDQSYQSSTESPELKTSSSSSQFPAGYDQHPSTTQATFKYASPSHDTYSTHSPPLPSQYLDTTLSPPAFDHYTPPAKNHKQDLYQPTRSPLLNHQSTPITLDYDPHIASSTTPTASTPLEQYKGTPAPLPPQYNPQSQYAQQAHFSPLPQTYSPHPYNQSPSPIPQSPYYPNPPPLPHQYDYYQSTPAPVPYDHYHSQGPPVPPQYYPPNPPSHSSPTPFSPASGSIHSTTAVTSHGEVGTTTPSPYDLSTVAPLQPQYDFIRETYENTDTSQPPPQPYDHSLAIAPPLPPQYDPSAYLTVPESHNYLDPIYRPYSTPLRKHNPSPSFEFHPTPHNPTHYIHNIPHYLTPSYDAYTQAPYPNGGGHPHYYKPLYNPYNPSVPQYSAGPGAQPYASQPYASHYSPQVPQLTQYESYNNYPPIYRPPVPPNYQPHQPVKSSHSNLYHVQASKELNPSSSSVATERTHELKEAREYKQHGYHNYQVTERPVRYHVKEGGNIRY